MVSQGTECEGFSLTRIGRGIKESVCSVVYAAVGLIREV